VFIMILLFVDMSWGKKDGTCQFVAPRRCLASIWINAEPWIRVS